MNNDTLQHEFDRFLSTLDEIKKLSNELDKQIKHYPYLQPFSGFLHKFINRTTETYKDLFRYIKIEEDDVINAASIISELNKSFQYFSYLFNKIIDDNLKIPRELYYMCQWFLRTSEIDTPFVISFRESLSCVEFYQLARSKSLHITYDKLYKSLEQMQFRLIFIPTEFRYRRNALKWPSVFHEFGHAIVDYNNYLVSNYKISPHISNQYAEYKVYKELGNKREEQRIQQAFWAKEMYSDCIATFVFGPSFVWRLLQDYFEIIGVCSSRTHPPFDIRIKKLIDFLESQGYEDKKFQLTENLNKRMKGVDQSDDASIINIQEIMVQISDFQEDFKIITFESLEKHINDVYPSLSFEKAVVELTSERPLILNPNALFNISIQVDSIESNLDLQDLIADCTRLFYVKTSFDKLKAHNP